MRRFPVGLHDPLREVVRKRRLTATQIGRGTSQKKKALNLIGECLKFLMHCGTFHF